MQPQRSPKINFREIFWVVRFSTFATISTQSGSGAFLRCPVQPQGTTRQCVMSCRRNLHDIHCSAKDHLNCDVDNDGQADVSNPSMILQKTRNERSGYANHRNGKPQAENHDPWMLACRTCDGQDIVEGHGNVSNDNLQTRLDQCFAGLACGICSSACSSSL